jgi:hypothetical protein
LIIFRKINVPNERFTVGMLFGNQNYTAKIGRGGKGEVR